VKQALIRAGCITFDALASALARSRQGLLSKSDPGSL
jgi:hypothetical protein